MLIQQMQLNSTANNGRRKSTCVILVSFWCHLLETNHQSNHQSKLNDENESTSKEKWGKSGRFHVRLTIGGWNPNFATSERRLAQINDRSGVASGRPEGVDHDQAVRIPLRMHQPDRIHRIQRERHRHQRHCLLLAADCPSLPRESWTKQLEMSRTSEQTGPPANQHKKKQTSAAATSFQTNQKSNQTFSGKNRRRYSHD